MNFIGKQIYTQCNECFGKLKFQLMIATIMLQKKLSQLQCHATINVLLSLGSSWVIGLSDLSVPVHLQSAGRLVLLHVVSHPPAG